MLTVELALDAWRNEVKLIFYWLSVFMQVLKFALLLHEGAHLEHLDQLEELIELKV